MTHFMWFGCALVRRGEEPVREELDGRSGVDGCLTVSGHTG